MTVEEKLEIARTTLVDLEWSGEEERCPSCGGSKQIGDHDDDCDIAYALDVLEGYHDAPPVVWVGEGDAPSVPLCPGGTPA